MEYSAGIEEWQGWMAVCEGLGRTAGIIYKAVHTEPVEGNNQYRRANPGEVDFVLAENLKEHVEPAH